LPTSNSGKTHEHRRQKEQLKKFEKKKNKHIAKLPDLEADVKN
jgi:hypothetical protein